MVLKVKSKKLDNSKKNSISPKKETNTIKPIKPVLTKNDNKAEENEKKESSVKLKSLKNPYKDKLFLKTLRCVKNETKTIQSHPKAQDKKSEITKASVLSVSEQSKNNNLQEHYSSIEENSKVKEEKKFSAEKFKEILKSELDVIENKLPTSSKSAKKFKKAKHIDKLKVNVNAKIIARKKDTLGKLEDTVVSKAEDKSTKAIVEIKKLVKENDLTLSKNIINSRYSSPKKKYDNEISLESENEKIDSLMEKDNITEDQLSTSNEESFLNALESKKEARKNIDLAPIDYRKEEKGILFNSRKKVRNTSSLEFNNMNTTRINNFDSVFKKQISTKDKNIEKKRNINMKFEVIYTSTRINVSKKLEGITTYINGYFGKEGSVNYAKKSFEKNVQKKLDKIYGYWKWDDKLFGKNKKAIKKVFKDEKKKFMDTLNIIFDRISTYIAKVLNESVKIIEDGKKETSKIYDNLSKEEKKLVQESYDSFNSKYKDLENKVNQKEKELVKSLALKYKKSVTSLDESFKAIEKKVSSTFLEKAHASIKGVIDTVNKLRKLLSSLASEISVFIPKIMKNPVSFLKLLSQGVKKGVTLFITNIKKHLLTGFIKWLTDSMSSVGITLPKNILSLSGVFSLVIQILDLGWDFIRRKSVKLFGEIKVKFLEKNFEMFKSFKKDGVKGIWKYLKKEFNNIKKIVIGKIKNMLITQIFLAGAKWLASLIIPGAAFVKAIYAIKDFIETLVKSAFALIPIIIKAIKALASGNVKGLIKYVEEGLAKIIPILISLFAKVLGLGGISKKVIKIVEKLRERISKSIDNLLDKVKNFFKKNKTTEDKKKNINISITQKLDKTLGEEVKFKVGNESHKLWIKSSGQAIDLIVDSKAIKIIKQLGLWEKDISTLDNRKQKSANKYIKKAKKLSNLALDEAKKEAILKKTILKDRVFTKNEYKKLSKADKKVVIKQLQLIKYLELLFAIFTNDRVNINSKEFELKIAKDSTAILKSLINDKNSEYFNKYNLIINKYKRKLKNEKGFVSSHLKAINTELNLKYDKLFVNDKFSNTSFQEILKEYLIDIFNKTLTKDEKREKKEEESKDYLLNTLISEDKKYEPNSSLEKVLIKDKKFITKYKYKNEADKDKLLKISYNFNKLNQNDVEIKKKLENLKIKKIKTDIAINKIILNHNVFTKEAYNEYKRLFQSDNMITEQILDSGYKESLHSLVKTEEYKKVTLKSVEESIASDAQKVETKSLFQKLKEKNQKDENKELIVKGLSDVLDKFLLSKDNTKKLLSVDYKGVSPFEKVQLEKRKINSDIWLSNYFNFMKKTYKDKV